MSITEVSTNRRLWFGMLQTCGDHYEGEVTCGYLQEDGCIFMFIENNSELEFIGNLSDEIISVIPKYFKVIINISSLDYHSDINAMQTYLRRTGVFLGEISEGILAKVLSRHYSPDHQPFTTRCVDGRTTDDIPVYGPYINEVLHKLEQLHRRKVRDRLRSAIGTTLVLGVDESYR